MELRLEPSLELRLEPSFKLEPDQSLKLRIVEEVGNQLMQATSFT